MRRPRTLVAALLLLVVLVLLAGPALLLRGKAANPVQGTAAPAGSTAPFNTIYLFYSAVAVNDWKTVQKITTEAMWSYLVTSGFVRQWEERRRADPTVAFSLFLVKAFTVDNERGTAWALGETQWAGGAGRPVNSLQTVFLERLAGRWLITRIDSRSAVEVTAEFYEAIQNGDWFAMRRLAEPGYWGRLVAKGIIVALQQEWAESKTGVYLVLHIRDFVQGEKKAWVSADVLWRPLTLYERETPVLVELTKTPAGWQITRIHGHWEEAK